MSKPVAETMHANIEAVGLPKWTEADETLARGLQKEMKVPETGMVKTIPPLRGQLEIPDDDKRWRVGRHRRHLLERADDYARLSGEHPGRAGT